MKDQTKPQAELSRLFQVKSSPIHGRGVFAKTDLAKGQYLGRYHGPIAKRNGIYVLWVQDDEGGDWFGISGRNLLRFLNHSNRPNAEFDGPHLYAKKRIKAGDEVTFHYGEDPGRYAD